MIKWHSFEKKKPKTGWYLACIAVTAPSSVDGIPQVAVCDFVTIAFFEPKYPDSHQWYSPLHEEIRITHWAKINLPAELDVTK